jgi:hypothetical protein
MGSTQVSERWTAARGRKFLEERNLQFSFFRKIAARGGKGCA